MLNSCASNKLLRITLRVYISNYLSLASMHVRYYYKRGDTQMQVEKVRNKVGITSIRPYM